MKYLLDTDRLSILQRKTGKDYDNLSTRMTRYPVSDFAMSIVTFHEQMLGCHAYINRARNTNSVVKSYDAIADLVGWRLGNETQQTCSYFKITEEL